MLVLTMLLYGMLGGKLLHAAAFAVLVANTDWDLERRRAARSVAGEVEGTASTTRARKAAGVVPRPGCGGEGEGGAACELVGASSDGGVGVGVGGVDAGGCGGGGRSGARGTRGARAVDKVQLLAGMSCRDSSCMNVADGLQGGGGNCSSRGYEAEV